MAVDLLADATWTCCRTPPDAAQTPKDLGELDVRWYPAVVPGTAAAALRAAGEPWEHVDYDAEDWWFRATFGASPASEAPFVLHLDGVATLADAWLNGEHCWESRNMFTASEVEIHSLGPSNDLSIRCRALGPLLAGRHPRGHWRTRLVDHQALRHYRTTLLGRIPAWAGEAAPVGPWRPLRLTPAGHAPLSVRRLDATVVGDDGLLSVEVAGLDRSGVRDARIVLQGEGVTLSTELTADDPAADGRPAGSGGAARDVLRATLRVPNVQRWWPHTHGPPTLYAVAVEAEGLHAELARVGFRSVEVDRSDGGFNVVVNGVPVFCRGACWVPPDPVSLRAGEAAVRQELHALRAANLNMVRVTGTMVYEDATFFDICDELGILVWQDCMLANLEPPDDPGFVALLEVELEQVFSSLRGRASLAVVSGGSEIEQQAAMAGVDRRHWAPRVLTDVVPQILGRILPDVPYVTSTPTGGDLPFSTDEGVAHYFGVGAYLRPFDDARRANVRFAAECLAFSIPPDPETVDEAFGGPQGAGHQPDWKRGVPRDAGAGWDFEDVRDHYVGEIFGEDVLALRYSDPDRYLQLGRAAVAACMSSVFGEWRRSGSSCGGGLVLSLRDLRPGAGWGLIDSRGRPKAPWYALRRVLAPVALFSTDEGLNGLCLHVVNDRDATLDGQLDIELIADGERLVERVTAAVTVGPRGQASVRASSLFDGFRDLTFAYRFGPSAYDVVVATLRDARGSVLSSSTFLPLGLARATEPDLGLRAQARRVGEREWVLDCSSRRFAQWVSVEIPGYVAQDSWFDLAPGRTHTVELRRIDGRRDIPRGRVRALNARADAPVEWEEAG